MTTEELLKALDEYDLRLTQARNALRDAGVPEVVGKPPDHRALGVAERIRLLAQERDVLRLRSSHLKDRNPQMTAAVMGAQEVRFLCRDQLPMRLSLYTDGASHSRGGLPGGWAWILVNETGPLKCGNGGRESTTNNVCELMAILEGLTWVQVNLVPPAHGPTRMEGLAALDVVSDSQYALGVSSGRFNATKNVEIVDRIRRTNDRLRQAGVVINWTWVRGHCGNVWNEKADAMATAAKQKVIDEISRRTTPSGDSA